MTETEKLKTHKWETKTLEELSEKIFSGAGVEEKDKGTGSFPAMKTGNLSSLKSIFFNKCSVFINPSLVNSGKTFSHGDILMIAQSGSEKMVGQSYLYTGNQICAAGGAIHVIKHTQNPEWLAYLMNSQFVRNQILEISRKKKVHGMPNRININDLRKIKVPLPPRHIQDLMVNHINSFSSRMADLELDTIKLIEERNTQYSYYSRKLLSRSN